VGSLYCLNGRKRPLVKVYLCLLGKNAKKLPRQKTKARLENEYCCLHFSERRPSAPPPLEYYMLSASRAQGENRGNSRFSLHRETETKGAAPNVLRIRRVHVAAAAPCACAVFHMGRVRHRHIITLVCCGVAYAGIKSGFFLVGVCSLRIQFMRSQSECIAHT
jgi:hypothetical protein